MSVVFSRGAHRRPIRLFCALLIACSAQAASYTGTNLPGAWTDFPIVVDAAATNLSLQVSGSASAYSYLLLKQGASPNLTDYEFAGKLDGQGNAISLETPELRATNYVVRVYTPSSSATHAFTLTVDPNQSGLRTASRPVAKPVASDAVGALPAGEWHYFQVEVPTVLPGWILVLSSTNAVDLYVRRGALPDTFTADRASLGAEVDTVFFTDLEATAGTYFIGVHVPGTAGSPANYTLQTAPGRLSTLAWDPGIAPDGTQAQVNETGEAGEYYFKVTPQSAVAGLWRVALQCTAGEADLHLSRGLLPSADHHEFGSTRLGSDGFVLHSSQFAAGQEWFIRVHAAAGAQWRLWSGDIWVRNLEVLAADGSSGSGPVTVGPEGLLFFKTTIPVGTPAWRLGLSGATNSILVKKNVAPHPLDTFLVRGYDLQQAGQMLVVPDYLVPGSETYFVGVAGAPGETLSLDSRQQAVSDLAFEATTSFTVSGDGYRTFRVPVPAAQLGWQVFLTPNAGLANVAVRQSLVPNEWNNDAFSEADGSVTDSVALSAPVLGDGVAYITVYGTGTFTCTLASGAPKASDINFVSVSTNAEPDRVGWKFYRVANLAQQNGALGWELWLTNQPPETELAIRRNALPFRRNYRRDDSAHVVSDGCVDQSNQEGFLQHPAHQADVWYVGVYSPDEPLGEFRLHSGDIVPATLSLDGSPLSRVAVPPERWEFFRADIPESILGWDIRLTEVSSGQPQLVVRRGQLPIDLTTGTGTGGNWFHPCSSTNWPIGYQWAAALDSTDAQYAADGAFEYGRILSMGMGNPLEPGTYYVGVRGGGASNSTTYAVSSRAVGDGLALPMNHLAFAGGRATNTALSVREAAYYRVEIPAGVTSWKVRLTMMEGDALLLAQRGAIPGTQRYLDTVRGFTGGRRMHQAGSEHFVMLPLDGESVLPAGVCSLAVVSQGRDPVPTLGRVGTGTCRYVIESVGMVPVTDLGTMGGTDLECADSLEGGELKAYRFTVPAGVPAVELALEDRTGQPAIAAVPGVLLPSAEICNNQPAFDDYGADGGWTQNRFESGDRITLVNVSGVCSVVVKANAAWGNPTPASYSLRVRAQPPTPVAFDGGSAPVTAQEPGSWRYYQITVPDGCLGWSLHLTNVLGGQPMIVVRRDLLPNETLTSDGNGWPQWYYGPSTSTNWPSGYQWAARQDWTRRSFSNDGNVNEEGRFLTATMRNPLEPGTYYVGILNAASSSEPTSYTLVSRGIGAGLQLPVVDLAFNGGTVTQHDLRPREAAFYRVTVPGGATSWQVKLAATEGESLLAVHQSVLPSTDDGWSPRVGYPPASGGRHQRLVGNDHFVLLPEDGQSSLVGGDYYLAVVSEGQSPSWNRIGTNTSRYTLTSVGELPADDLGVIGSAEVTRVHALEAGELRAYRFTVPTGVSSVDLRLLHRTNHPVMTVRPGTAWPYRSPGETDLTLDTYGVEGGQATGRLDNPEIIGIANPVPGVHSLIVKARAPDLLGYEQAPASYTLTVRTADTVPVTFDGGGATITNQIAGAWQHFVVDVPNDIIGWDVRVTDVVGGQPRLVVRRAELPQVLGTMPWSSPYQETNWPSGHQIAAGLDWTRRERSAGDVAESGQILALGMGNPLEPGTYYVGVLNEASSEPTSYRLSSRGVGPGRSLPVVDLAFESGSVTNSGLLPREAAYYRVEVPAGAPSWKVKLTGLAGESLLALLQTTIPNVGAEGFHAIAYPPRGSLAGARKMQKPGNEHFILLPREGELSLPPGAYYLAVVGEGVNPIDSFHVGTGSSSYVLQSLGQLEVRQLGTAEPNPVATSNLLEGGETAVYQFTVPVGAPAVEAALVDRSGNPVLAMRPGDRLTHFYDYWLFRLLGEYGADGGYSSEIRGDPNILTLANPTPGVHSLTVKAAEDSGGTYWDSAYTLRIRILPTPELNFSSELNTNGWSNTASGLLADRQSAFFKVTVPETLAGAPIPGWRLDLDCAQGNAMLRVRRDTLPADNASWMSPFAGPSAIVVPPFLTNGTWYVEVLAEGSTEYALTSRALTLERTPWIMPEPGQPTPAPGLTAPEFGDSGVNPAGVPLADDQGIDLEQGRYHYYAFVVPTNNVGLVRTTLESINGNPDLYLRAGAPPTDTHGSQGGPWYDLVERALTDVAGTEYGNWVVLDGRTESRLTPGTWYAAVRAAGGANARYRLRLSTGAVLDLPLDGGNATAQTLNAGDWRHYRFQLPVNSPLEWSLSVVPQAGEVDTFLRDTLPPGRGFYSDWSPIRDWSSDAKNQGPYPSPLTPGTVTLTLPPLRAGHTYYLGVRARTDAIFSVHSQVGADTLSAPALDFYTGSLTTTLPPHGTLLRRIDVPLDAVRWRHTSTHSSDVRVSLEQGTLPLETGAHWCSTWENSSWNQSLRPQTFWPWVAGQSYYLWVTNTSEASQPFQLTMDGRTDATEDEDLDGLPDGWEILHFGEVWMQGGDGDPDGDGLPNSQECLFNSDPMNASTPGLFDRLQIVSDTELELHFAGETGLRYRIEVSVDLVEWTSVTVVTNTPGAFSLSLPTASQERRFYRSVLQP